MTLNGLIRLEASGPFVQIRSEKVQMSRRIRRRLGYSLTGPFDHDPV